jgi:chromosome segregation ATPase
MKKLGFVPTKDVNETIKKLKNKIHKKQKRIRGLKQDASITQKNFTWHVKHFMDMQRDSRGVVTLSKQDQLHLMEIIRSTKKTGQSPKKVYNNALQLCQSETYDLDAKYKELTTKPKKYSVRLKSSFSEVNKVRAKDE